MKMFYNIVVALVFGLFMIGCDAFQKDKGDDTDAQPAAEDTAETADKEEAATSE